MQRDIALVIDIDVPIRAIEDVIKKIKTDIIEEVKLFDVYQGKQVPDGKKSLAFGLCFRDSEKTLTDEDAGKAMTKILKGLEEVGAALRDI